MKSIRQQLTVCIMAALVVLYGLAAFFCYARTTAMLNQQFDSALAERARALCALVTREPDGRLEVVHADATMAEFGVRRQTQFLQIWDPADGTLQRSGSLHGKDLSPPASSDSTSYWDAPLPDGAAGRGVRIRFVPAVEEDEDDHPAPVAAAVAPSQSSAVQSYTLALFRDRAPVARVQRVLISTLLLTFALLCAATLVAVPMVVSRSLAALDRVSTHAARIDASSLSSSFPVGDVPAELKPICRRLNDLLLRLEAAFLRERRFSADVAHELRTPIAELRALAEVALKWPGDARTTAVAFQDALGVAAQMESVVTALLALARLDSDGLKARCEEVDLSAVVRDAWESLGDRARANDLAATFALPDSAPAWADRAMIRALAGNLLSNAVDYCPAGGLIDCVVRCGQDSVELCVANTNPSLTAQDLRQMLQPFWRKDPSRSDPAHSGLGLALVSAYAKALGASLDIALTPENLFRVKVRLPAPPPPREIARPQTAVGMT